MNLTFYLTKFCFYISQNFHNHDIAAHNVDVPTQLLAILDVMKNGSAVEEENFFVFTAKVVSLKKQAYNDT